jgi:hypothetical protein
LESLETLFVEENARPWAPAAQRGDEAVESLGDHLRAVRNTR